MGLLSRLFGRPDHVTLSGTGDFDLEVKGESHYQAALEAICGPRKEAGEERTVDAQLILDDRNPHDSQAVRVEIDGRLVGYLGRDAARAYRKALRDSGHPRAVATCKAQIRGGWRRTSGRGERLGSYGVWLDVPVVE